MEINGGELVAIAMFACIAISIIGTSYFGYSRRRESERTVRAFAESGNPLDAAAIGTLMAQHERLSAPKILQLWGCVVGVTIALVGPLLNTGHNHEGIYGTIAGGIMIAAVGGSLLGAARIVRA